MAVLGTLCNSPKAAAASQIWLLRKESLTYFLWATPPSRPTGNWQINDVSRIILEHKRILCSVDMDFDISLIAAWSNRRVGSQQLMERSDHDLKWHQPKRQSDQSKHLPLDLLFDIYSIRRYRQAHKVCNSSALHFQFIRTFSLSLLSPFHTAKRWCAQSIALVAHMNDVPMYAMGGIIYRLYRRIVWDGL